MTPRPAFLPVGSGGDNLASFCTIFSAGGKTCKNCVDIGSGLCASLVRGTISVAGASPHHSAAPAINDGMLVEDCLPWLGGMWLGGCSVSDRKTMAGNLGQITLFIAGVEIAKKSFPQSMFMIDKDLVEFVVFGRIDKPLNLNRLVNCQNRMRKKRGINFCG